MNNSRKKGRSKAKQGLDPGLLAIVGTGTLAIWLLDIGRGHILVLLTTIVVGVAIHAMMNAAVVRRRKLRGSAHGRSLLRLLGLLRLRSGNSQDV